jgi:transposase-like protein
LGEFGETMPGGKAFAQLLTIERSAKQMSLERKAYPLSLRHLEETAAERGIAVEHSTVHRWAIKLLPGLCQVKAAAKRFFRRVLRSNPVPRKIVTDQLRSYATAKADISELAHVKHVFVKAAARVNNRAEDSHEPTRKRERQMCGFRDARRTQAFLSCFGPIRQRFALPRHQMDAACHRALLKERIATWNDWTVTGPVNKPI